MRSLGLVFLMAGAAAAQESQSTSMPAPVEEAPGTNSPGSEWGAVDPGKGFLLGRTSIGELRMSVYALFRYINQLPANQTFLDHLGRERVVDTRNDFQFHRAMVFWDGWAFDPRFLYNVTLWTVNSTNDIAVIGALGWNFGRALRLFGGWNGQPGTRSLAGSHPYWLANDRVMADEYFRPFFTSGLWATGEPIPRFFYTVMIGNNNSQLRISATQLTRDLSQGASLWVLPTTGEFGPRGAFGDYERHDELATRFGVSSVHSREDAFQELNSTYPDNTTIRLSDSVNLFDPGSLAPGVSVQKADYLVLSADAGLKYKGLFLQAEYYNRWLWNFVADGPLPVSHLHAQGFYVQGSYMVVPRWLELYGATSQIFGEFDRHPWEVLGGGNFYLAGQRGLRLNAQVIYVDRSPVSSTFGFYVGGQKGTTISVAASVFY